VSVVLVTGAGGFVGSAIVRRLVHGPVSFVEGAPVEQVVAESDRVAGRFSMRGTHAGTLFGIPATGRAIDVGVMVIARFDAASCIDKGVHGPRHSPHSASGDGHQDDDEPNRQRGYRHDAEPGEKAAGHGAHQRCHGQHRDRKASDPSHECRRTATPAPSASGGEWFAFWPPGRAARRRWSPPAPHRSGGSANR